VLLASDQLGSIDLLTYSQVGVRVYKHRKMATGGEICEDGLEFWLSMIILHNSLWTIKVFCLYIDKQLCSDYALACRFQCQFIFNLSVSGYRSTRHTGVV